jgi:hypothetical protein
MPLEDATMLSNEENNLETPQNLLEFKIPMNQSHKYMFKTLEELKSLPVEYVPILKGYIGEVDFNEKV